MPLASNADMHPRANESRLFSQPITLTKIARSGGMSTPTSTQHIAETHSRPNCQFQVSLRNLVSHIPARES